MRLTKKIPPHLTCTSLARHFPRVLPSTPNGNGQRGGALFPTLDAESRSDHSCRSALMGSLPSWSPRAFLSRCAQPPGDLVLRKPVQTGWERTGILWPPPATRVTRFSGLSGSERRVNFSHGRKPH